jgi:hypothetical protein
MVGLQARSDVAAQGDHAGRGPRRLDHRAAYSYQTSPNERRDVDVNVRRANGVWTVAIADIAQAVGEKRGAQVALIFGKLLPKGYQRESFAGKKANPLDAARIAELGRFVETAMKLTKVPVCRWASTRTATSYSPTDSACASWASRRRSTRARVT